VDHPISLIRQVALIRQNNLNSTNIVIFRQKKAEIDKAIQKQSKLHRQNATTNANDLHDRLFVSFFTN